MAFDLILKAAQKPVSSKCFWLLFLGTEVMLAFGYAGEGAQKKGRPGMEWIWATCASGSRILGVDLTGQEGGLYRGGSGRHLCRP